MEFRPIAQNLFATNNLPPFKGGIDRGVRRRLLVITFNRVIPEKDRIENIGRRIAEDEADLLLAWAVEGASRLIRNHNFTIPKSCEQPLIDWIYDADPVLAWLEQCTEVTATLDDQRRVRTNVAYSNFSNWAMAEGFNRDKLPAINGFTQRVRANASRYHSP